jgi:membrane-bound ClpP family serine protease
LVYLGFRLSSYAQLNHGLVTALLISINFFFETDLSYTLRGLVFIVVGSGFIVANVLLSRNKARKSGQTNITLPPDTK